VGKLSSKTTTILFENSHKNGKIPKKMGKFLFIVEHVAFPKRASFLQISIKMGNYPYNWENSYKNGKILISNGKFIFLAYPP